MTLLVEERPQRRRNLNKIEWEFYYAFESYGVKIGFRSTHCEIIEDLKERLPCLLPTGIQEIDFAQSEHVYSIIWATGRRSKRIVYKGEEEILRTEAKSWRLDHFESNIRLTVAEFAKNFAFLHAGAVRYKDKAIIFPARSFSGKTTLVAELAKSGLEYYSDEYAVIDERGFLHPFPKQLSMRGIINEHEQLDIDVEEFGGKKGKEPIRIGLILVSKFVKRAKFQPKVLSAGEGIIESIANSVSIRQNPQFVLKVLGTVMKEAKIIKTNRSEARQFVGKFLPYIEELGIFNGDGKGKTNQ